MRHILLLLTLVGTVSVLGASSAQAGDALAYAGQQIAVEDRAAAWSSPTNLSNSTANSRAPDLAVTAGGVVHVVWEEEGGLYHTFGKGDSWSAPAEIFLGDSASLVAGSGDSVHMAYVSESGATFDVFYARWNGAEWTLPVNVSRTTAVSSTPVIVRTPGGPLHAIWVENTGGTQTLYHGQSSNGNAWSIFPLPSGSGSAPAAAGAGGDVVHLAWQSADPLTDLGEIWYAQFSDGSWSWPENVSDSPDEASAVPTVAAGPDGSVHIAWQEGLNANTGIYYASGTLGDWSQPVEVPGTLKEVQLPDLSIDATNNGFLLWDEGSTIVGRRLNAQTGTWSERQEVAGNAAGISDPAVSVERGAVHAVWAQEISAFNWDIFYSAQNTVSVYLPLILRSQPR